ncbi:hypothetical protein [Achromobacter aloeverae]|uniref:Transcriptional regulator n=1 Tax=Achromobacter aloeverae TaxID=1750518 RepID=A0A4Q1HUG5_9BURK|nr:hypothetical protein [Achromobacter aloeverae]RXN93345.1 hypothetical protein C7R54_06540 [Achromobacter aloeverae]
MLTREQLKVLKAIHAGGPVADNPHTDLLLERGLLARQPGMPGLAVTPAGRRAIGLGEAFGDSILDALLPGEGASQAVKPH